MVLWSVIMSAVGTGGIAAGTDGIAVGVASVPMVMWSVNIGCCRADGGSGGGSGADGGVGWRWSCCAGAGAVSNGAFCVLRTRASVSSKNRAVFSLSFCTKINKALQRLRLPFRSTLYFASCVIRWSCAFHILREEHL